MAREPLDFDADGNEEEQRLRPQRLEEMNARLAKTSKSDRDAVVHLDRARQERLKTR